jgi:hypothetical protein
MKKFMAVYMGSATPTGARPDQETMQKGIAAWHKWMTDHAAQVVEGGGPLGKTKKTGKDGVSDITNRMTGYVVVQAESHQAAAEMFRDHPHFAIFPGDSVEVMECLPIPGMG